MVRDMDALVRSLSAAERAKLALRLEALEARQRVQQRVQMQPAPDPFVGPAQGSVAVIRTSKERATGLEPATSSLGSWHSTN